MNIKRVVIFTIVIFLMIVIIRYPVFWPGTWSDQSTAYHQWLYINPDATGDFPVLTDIEGDPIPDYMIIPAFRKDRLIFVNRMPKAVDVRFTDDAIFGAANKEFTIEPGKRKVQKVIGPSANYTFEMNAGSGWVAPPTVKVGDDP